MTFFPHLRQRLRQHYCAHVVYYMETMTGRDANGMVHAICDKCGKDLMAKCGLDLPARLAQRPVAPVVTPS